MAATVITPEDLQEFKQDLLSEMKKLLSERQGLPSHKWLKSHEIRRLLSVSQGTLQHLRQKGILPFTKIGGVIYYDIEDIEKMIKDNKNNRDFPNRKNNPWRKI